MSKRPERDKFLTYLTILGGIAFFISEEKCKELNAYIKEFLEREKIKRDYPPMP